MNDELKTFCREIYENTMTVYGLSLVHGERALTPSRVHEIDIQTQKEAIKEAAIQCMARFPNVSSADIWKTVYAIHINKKSGIDDADVIGAVISADQSWKKSSGHAFEAMIKEIGNRALNPSGIEILLQRDLSLLLKGGEIANGSRDIEWLKNQVDGEIFDLYAAVNKNGKKFIYGCIQSKTSIRDRVTRDREPSVHAMEAFFWSVCICLDGDFLRLPKFQFMVNGGSPEFPKNGWHGMYTFSANETNGRIYPTDISFTNIKTHALQAADYWLSQRQWFNQDWKAD